MKKAEALARLLAAAGEVAILILYTAGAVSKVIDPRPAFEIAESVTGNPWMSAAVLALAMAIEAGLASAMWLRVLRGAAALRTGLGVLVLFTIWLLAARSVVGEDAPCGCLSAFVQGTVSDAISANLVVVGELTVAVLGGWWAASRKRKRDAAGPADAASLGA